MSWPIEGSRIRGYTFGNPFGRVPPGHQTQISELHNTSTVQVSIKNLNQGPTRSSDKNKRSLPTIAAIALNTIKPSLAKFVSTGVSRLTNALGIVHHGAPLGMASFYSYPI